MKNTLIILLSIALVACFVVGYLNKSASSELVSIKTDTIYVTNIIRDTIPQLLVKTEIKHVTDTFIINNTDTIMLDIPISQSHYSNTIDSISYDAYVSGYKAELDSIAFKVTYPIINTTERWILNNKKWHDKFNVRIQVGYGYSTRYKNLTPYVGVGISFEI